MNRRSFAAAVATLLIAPSTLVAKMLPIRPAEVMATDGSQTIKALSYQAAGEFAELWMTSNRLRGRNSSVQWHFRHDGLADLTLQWYSDANSR